MMRVHSSSAATIERLRAHAIRPTDQRVEIARFLLGDDRHCSAEQLYEQVNRHGSRPVSRATVYNTLNLFVDKGLIRVFTVEPGKLVYDSNVKVHHHFYNEATGELIDIPDDRVRVSLPELPQKTELAGVEVFVRLRRGGYK